MKHFYIILLAVVTSFTASARDLQSLRTTASRHQAVRHSQSTALSTNLRPKAKHQQFHSNRISILPPIATDPSLLEGSWEITFGDFYFPDAIFDYLTVEFEAFLDPGNEIWFEDPTGYEWPMVGIFDTKNSTLTFDTYCLGTYGDYYVFQVPYVIDENDILVEQPFTAKYNATDDVIVFGDNVGFTWYGCYAEDIDTRNHVFNIYDITLAQRPQPKPFDEVQPGQWEKVGTAILEDGWVLPGYGLVGAQNPYNVELERKIDNPNIFRLWRPYRSEGCPVVEANESVYEGQIVLDLTDPDHVLVIPDMPGGFKDRTIGEFYMTNWLYWAMNYYNLTKEEAIARAERRGSCDTYADGIVVIDLENVLWSIAPENFIGYYSWNNNPQPSVIIFPTELDNLQVIITDNDKVSAPEYYTLQGVRVANPTPGNIYIKKEGDKTTKVIIND